MERGIIRILVIGLICVFIVSCISQVNGSEYPDFPKNKMIIVGHYSTVEEQESKGISRDFNITCNQGDISVFFGKWSKSGYSSWVFARHLSKEFTYFHAPEFYGICRDGQVFGISYGDFRYS